MKKITEAEALAVVTKPMGRVSRLRAMLLNLEPGEYLLVERSDWKWKGKAPSVMCRRLEEHGSKRYDCKKALDGSGWIIKRLK